MNQLLAFSESLSPRNSLEQYLNTIKKFNILSAEEEKELAFKLHDNQCMESARKLTLHHLRFVVYISASYAGYGLSREDLIQEGNIGLLKAVKRFNPAQGVRLSSFAVHWIKAEIHEYIIKNWKLVRVATTKAQRKLFFNLRKLKKTSALTEEKTNEIATKLKVKPDEVREMNKRLTAFDTVYETTDFKDPENNNSLLSHHEGSASSNPATINEVRQNDSINSKVLASVLRSLAPRSQYIIDHRWLLPTKKTLLELSQELDISIERVRQLEKIALGKMKIELEQTNSITI